MSDVEARVWPAGEEDLARVAELLGAFRDWIGAATPSDERMLASVERIRDRGDADYLLGALGSAPADGVCQLRYRWSVWTDSEDAWIEDVYVRETARGHGLGRALVELALERARARGCARVELDVDEGNAAALALYHRLGFSGDLKADERSLLLGRAL
jgi:ribosomal protein S18 acetylase RimI-like enzyme